MKVAFWSSERNRGVTSCTLAAAYLGATVRNMRIALLDNHYSDRKLGRLIFGQINGSKGYFGKAGPGNREWWGPGYFCGIPNGMVNTSIEIIDDRLWFLYPDIMGDECMFEQDFVNKLEKSGKNDRHYFIDTQGGNNLSTKEILDVADLVIVLLPDDVYRVNIFLDKYSSLIDKSILVFNQFRSDLNNSRKLICRQHGINDDRMTVIPYVREITESVCVGSFESCMRDYVRGNSSQAAGMYFGAVKRLLGMIERESSKCEKTFIVAEAVTEGKLSLSELREAQVQRRAYCSLQRDLRITASAYL